MHLLPTFGTIRLSEISPVQIMDFFKKLSAVGLKPKSLLNLYVLLQKMLNLAVAQPDSEVESMKKLEEAFFGELCSTVLKTGVEDQSESVN